MDLRRDAAGRVDLFTAPEGVFDYGYDNTHQLTSATFTLASGYTGGTPASEAFDFDLTGNRNSQTVGTSTTTTTVDRNRLLSDGTYSYTYDGEGNRVTKTLLVSGNPTGATENYTWDHRNRLVKVEFRNSPGGTLTKTVVNSYDAFDRRVMKQVDDNGDGTFDRTERYVHDGDDLVLILDGSTSAGTVLHRFLHGPAIDQIFADEDNVNGLMWYLADNQGTVRDVVNNSGAVVNHLTYSPFGKLASESDPSKTPFVAYTSQDLDEDLGLQLHGKRWFDPATGRWMSEDPIRFAAGDVNVQRYVGNTAPNAIDPSGLDRFDDLAEDLVPLTPPSSTDVGSVGEHYNQIARERARAAQELRDFASLPVEEQRQIAESRARSIARPPSEIGPNRGGGFTQEEVEQEAYRSLGPLRVMIPGGPFEKAVSVIGSVAGGYPRPFNIKPSTPKLLLPNTITPSEHAEIQAIADKYKTTIDIVGSRAAGKGRNIDSNLPVGKDVEGGPRTRSDIDFRIDTKHPQVDELMNELNKVGNGAGSAKIKHGTDHRETYPPFIRICPRE